MKRRKCKRRVKRELAEARESEAARDRLREAWLSDKCWACGKCPGMLLRLAASRPVMAP